MHACPQRRTMGVHGMTGQHAASGLGAWSNQKMQMVGKHCVCARPSTHRHMVCVGLALAHPYARVPPKAYYGCSWHDRSACSKWIRCLVKPKNANGRQALCMCTAVYTQTHGMCGACVSTPLCTRAPRGVLWAFYAFLRVSS